MLRTPLSITRRGIRQVQIKRNASTDTLVNNIESRWNILSTAERNTITAQLESAQKNDWKVMSLEDKKAAYHVSYGPHGPRTPLTQPGHGAKVFGGVAGVLGVSAALFYAARSGGQERPQTMNKEWQEATNEYLKSQNSNPITGISSEGYKGKGYISNL